VEYEKTESATDKFEKAAIEPPFFTDMHQRNLQASTVRSPMNRIAPPAVTATIKEKIQLRNATASNTGSRKRTELEKAKPSRRKLDRTTDFERIGFC